MKKFYELFAQPSYVPWSTSELRVRFCAPLNRLKPSSNMFLLTIPSRCFFCGSFILFLSCFVMLSCTSVCWCLVVTCWERADLLALFCDVLLCRFHFPIGILGQVWCLIVSIPDLCPFSYFTCSSEFTLVKMPNCLKSHVAAHMCFVWEIRKMIFDYALLSKGLTYVFGNLIGDSHCLSASAEARKIPNCALTQNMVDYETWVQNLDSNSIV